jgi:hypothetical protein
MIQIGIVGVGFMVMGMKRHRMLQVLKNLRRLRGKPAQLGHSLCS